jgi:predicted enzyme related to lactoylglutathione lyase
MPMEVLFAGVRVRDLASAIDWYGRLFGRPADIVPNEQEVMWRVTDGGWLYVLQEPSSAGGGLVTIAVTDLDAEVAALADRGLPFAPIEPVGDAGRRSSMQDPDGNSINLIQVAN